MPSPKPSVALKPKELFLKTSDASFAQTLSENDQFHRILSAAFTQWSFGRIPDPATHFRTEAVKDFITTLLTIGVPTETVTPEQSGELERE